MSTKKKDKSVSSRTSAKKSKTSVAAIPPKAGQQKTAPQKPFKLKINPEFKKLLSPLTKEEYELLKESISEHGQLDPIRVGKDGTIYDGHNRYRICMELGIVPRHEIFDIGDDESIEIWIIEQQMGRRNLSDFQRAEYALKHKTLIAAKAKKNQRAGGGAVRAKLPKPVNTRDELAKIARVSPRTFSKTEHIAKYADEETKEKLRSDDLSIHKAYTDLKAEQAKKEPAKSKTATSASTGKNEKPAKQQDAAQSGKSQEVSTVLRPTEIPSPDTLAAAMTEKDIDELAQYLTKFLYNLAVNKCESQTLLSISLLKGCFNLMNRIQQGMAIMNICDFLKEQTVFDNLTVVERIFKRTDTEQQDDEVDVSISQ